MTQSVIDVKRPQGFEKDLEMQQGTGGSTRPFSPPKQILYEKPWSKAVWRLSADGFISLCKFSQLQIVHAPIHRQLDPLLKHPEFLGGSLVVILDVEGF